MLVHQSASPNMAQLPDKKHKRTTCVDAVIMGRLWYSLRRICPRPEVQRRTYSAASLFHRLVQHCMGTVLGIRTVSELHSTLRHSY
jgi:hypothetical protein